MGDDPRLRDLIVKRDVWGGESGSGDEKRALNAQEFEGMDIVMVGFPFDEGTVRNGGRGGSKTGPAVFLEMALKTGTLINPEYDIDLTPLKILYAGCVKGDTMEAAHVELEQVVYEIVSRGAIPFIVGGSNDQSYPNAAALLRNFEGKGLKLGVVNVDAHLDVRPFKDGKAHSGSPFRQLLEDPRFDGSFVEFAAQGNQCSKAHADYVKSRGGKIEWLSSIRGSGLSAAQYFEEKTLSYFESRVDRIFFSFDIDSIQMADCPGVSAPGVVGLTSQEALLMCMAAGRNPRVCAMDMSEFNPAAESYNTSKLTAAMFYYFTMGVALRKAAASASGSVAASASTSASSPSKL